MILYAFKPHTVETKPAWPGAPLRSWRWALHADRWSIGFHEHVRGLSHSVEWWPACAYAYVGVAWDLQFGYSHMYYDGDHHAFWLGPLFVTWGR